MSLPVFIIIVIIIIISVIMMIKCEAKTGSLSKPESAEQELQLHDILHSCDLK